MSLSRRAFVRTLGIGTAGALTSSWIGARGREGFVWGAEGLPVAGADEINLANNENPVGPGKVVLEAIRKAMGEDCSKTGRYPFAYHDPLKEAIAAKFSKFGVKPENVLIGAGSTQILRDCTQLYTAKDKPLVGSMPTYEACSRYAELIENPVKQIPLDTNLRMDLDPTLTVVKDAGLLFYCNPNNPTATLISGGDTMQFLEDVSKRSPETRILVDEAYFDYVTEPSHETKIPLALEDKRVIVARTFSKAYGMAGLRVGYGIAHKDTIEELSKWHAGNQVSSLSLAAATAAIQQDPSFIENERARNTKVRDFTRGFFHEAGYEVTESQTNFLFVDLRMRIEDFQAGCKERGVRVGRPFPPLWTRARISLGTMEEMKQATKVFAGVLEIKAKAAAA
jgi:histidinol-phosphate aminotransferase